MSFNVTAQIGSPSERGRALREQHAREQEHAIHERNPNMSKETSRTGITRRRLDRDAAEQALASAHEAFIELLDAAQSAMERESRMKSARDLAASEDARRAPVLDRRR